MAIIIVKSIGIWLLLVVLAIVNGTVREKLFALYLGQRWALPFSGLLLSLLIFITTFAAFPFFGVTNASQAWLIGSLWLLLTIAFEFLFGHFVAGDSWSKLLEAYDLVHGNLWILVLVITALSPYLAGKARGCF